MTMTAIAIAITGDNTTTLTTGIIIVGIPVRIGLGTVTGSSSAVSAWNTIAPMRSSGAPTGAGVTNTAMMMITGSLNGSGPRDAGRCLPELPESHVRHPQ